MSDERFFINPGDVDAFGFGWGRLTLTVGPEVNGAKTFSGGVVDLPSGQGHSRHNHPGSEEIIFVISGAGEQMVEDASGKPIVQKVGPGCTIFVPESRYHSTLNSGAGPMQLFVVYSPAGPERASALIAGFSVVEENLRGRHCERSEATQGPRTTLTAAPGLFRRCAPRNDGRGYSAAAV